MATERLKVSINPREFLYVPNILSLSRLVLLPLIVFGLTKRTVPYKAFTFSLMMLSILTDALDGYLARRLGEVSALGKILDPIGDKICIGVVAIAVTILRDFPWWAMGIILFRDLGIVIGGMFMVGQLSIITSSNIWGKATSHIQSISIIAYAFEIPKRSYPLTVALVFTAVSSISYTMEFINLIKEQRKSNSK
jgi:CDP-diacylglycerol--glycerol-3-phosphate 3-phosphatidyltransferase